MKNKVYGRGLFEEKCIYYWKDQNNCREVVYTPVYL